MCTYGLSTMRSSQLIGVVIADDDDDDGGDQDFSMPTVLTLVSRGRQPGTSQAVHQCIVQSLAAFLICISYPFHQDHSVDLQCVESREIFSIERSLCVISWFSCLWSCLGRSSHLCCLIMREICLYCSFI